MRTPLAYANSTFLSEYKCRFGNSNGMGFFSELELNQDSCEHLLNILVCMDNGKYQVQGLVSTLPSL